MANTPDAVPRSLARGAGALALFVHGVAHVAVYPMSGGDGVGVDDGRFWVPLSLAHDAAGWAARVLLVVSAAAFLAASVVLVRDRRTERWAALAIPASGTSIAAVALLWNGLHPRPSALWVGPAVSAVVIVVALVAMVRSSDDDGAATPRR